jgi:PTS system N-acetylglucosamine-specific IIC component
LFRVVIRALNLQTPGRESEQQPLVAATPALGDRGPAFVRALGGAANLVSVDACTTRLRLVVADQKVIDEAA